jgi:hypothetical protein
MYVDVIDHTQHTLRDRLSSGNKFQPDYKKCMESRNRPGVAQGVPGGLGSQISWHSLREGGEIVSLTHQPPLPQECSWYLFSLGSDSTPETWKGRKEIGHWKIQWHHRDFFLCKRIFIKTIIHTIDSSWHSARYYKTHNTRCNWTESSGRVELIWKSSQAQEGIGYLSRAHHCYGQPMTSKYLSVTRALRTWRYSFHLARRKSSYSPKEKGDVGL